MRVTVETGELLFGRRKSIKLLNDAWTEPATRIVAFKAWGGVGKSTLVRVWTEQMAEDNYREADYVFAWSFYSQGTGDRVTSADQFIAEALKFFGDEDPTAGSPWDKGERLARLLAQQRTLLLLDGMEPLQNSGAQDVGGRRGTIKDPALQSLLVNLARDNPGLCVISTREDVTDLQDERLRDAVIHQDLEQVDAPAGRALLRVQGIHGTDEQLENAVCAFGRHALAVNLLASYLNETAAGDITAAAAIANIDVPLDQGKHPRRVIAAWQRHLGEGAEVQLLRILGLFDRPATAGELAAVTADPPILGLTDQLPVGRTLLDSAAVERLRQIGLIARTSKHRPDILDTHPLIREHFSEKRVKDEGGRAKDEDHSPFKEAHRRLYEHLKSVPKDEMRDNLNDMMPLYHAVAHGCKAGLYYDAVKEVFAKRIQRWDELFSARRLGAFSQNWSALSCFIDEATQEPVIGLSDHWRSYVVGMIGAQLRPLGNMHTAAQSMQLSLCINKSISDWRVAARNCRYLSEILFLTGQLSDALKHAIESIELADRSKKLAERMVDRTVLGSICHHLGYIDQARRAFREAEDFMRELQNESPYLCTLWGFRYCELLLDLGDVEEVKTRATQTLALSANIEKFDAVFKRSIELDLGLLNVPLDQLTLGRAFLLEGNLDKANYYLTGALTGLRRAARKEFVLPALISRAVAYRKQDQWHEAANELSEAEWLAKRSSMLIWQIEAALERVRLALCRAKSQIPNDRSQIKLAREKLDEAKRLVKNTERPYEPHAPDWADWKPPEYVDVFKKGDIVGYHCRNDEIERLQNAIDALPAS